MIPWNGLGSGDSDRRQEKIMHDITAMQAAAVPFRGYDNRLLLDRNRFVAAWIKDHIDGK